METTRKLFGGLKREVDRVERRIDQQERQATQIDARGIWPIMFGIVLTGIPDELAHFKILGWVAIAAVAIGTLMLAQAAFKSHTLESAGVR